MDFGLEKKIDKENWKKQLIFRANHRGIKEMDIVLGSFVKKNIHNFTDNELLELEAVLKIDDRDLYSYLTKENPVPEILKTDLLIKILESENLNLL